MSPLHPYPAPEFGAYVCHAGIDFVTLTSDDPLAFNALRKLGARVPTNPEAPYSYPHLTTLHDPRPKHIAYLDGLTPGACVHELEVFLDFYPRSPKSAIARQEALATMQEFLLSRIYPWDGPGLQLAARTSSRPKEYCIFLPREWFPMEKGSGVQIDRLPRHHETLYFGHSDAKYADLAQPHFASMRVYRKVTNDGKPLPEKEWRIRMEVTLNRDGCESFGLRRLQDLYALDYRRLAPYFRLVEPRVGLAVPKKTLRKFPWLRRAVESAQRNLIDEIQTTGAYTACARSGVNVSKACAHAKGSRKVGQMLDNLSKSFDRYDRQELDGVVAELVALEQLETAPTVTPTELETVW